MSISPFDPTETLGSLVLGFIIFGRFVAEERRVAPMRRRTLWKPSHIARCGTIKSNTGGSDKSVAAYAEPREGDFYRLRQPSVDVRPSVFYCPKGH